jgi:predicted nucleotidyltransferase
MGTRLTTQEIISVLKQQKPQLQEKFHVKEIGLFGSFARGEANEKSDIDFLVVIDAPLETYRQSKEALHDYLKNIFGREVDLANPRSLKPHYKEHILRQAVYA